MQNNELTDQDLAVIIRAIRDGAGIGDVCNVTNEQIESLYALAYNLYTSGNFEDAGVVFQALCLYRHKDVRFWMGLGGCRQALGEYKGAIDAYGMAGAAGLLADPQPFLFGAQCCLKMGDRAGAADALRGVLARGDENDPAHASCHEKARALLSMLEQNA